MATIIGFQPLKTTLLHSQKNKSQVLHTTLHTLHLSSGNRNPLSADQRSSSFTKMAFDHHFRSHQRLLIMVAQATDKSESEADTSPVSSWKNWFVGLILSIAIPSLRHKWGPLLALKSKVDMAIDTVEAVTEVVEELSEEVEKVAEAVAEKLPEDAKLKEAVESIEHLAEEAVKKAELAKDVIHKVEEAEEEVEKALTTGGTDSGSVKAEEKP